MIPKIIHYCWFGNNPKPKLFYKCFKSWRKYCPDYRIIEWNENTLDLTNSPTYVHQAYASKKWAFVSDYVRFLILSKYGGIYLDTDMELLHTLDPFLKHEAFSCTEDGDHISAGAMGCVPDYALFGEFEKLYHDMSFVNPDGSLNTTTVVELMTEYCQGKGYRAKNILQEFCGFTIYPSEFFYPLSWLDGVMCKTENTVAIHWFAGSWTTRQQKRDKIIRYAKKRVKPYIVALIGKDKFENIKKMLHYGSGH